MDNNFDISETIPHLNFIADGEQTSFCFQFLIFEPSNVTIYLDGQKTTSGFEIEHSPNITGGTVIFSIAPAAGVKVTLVRDLTIQRVSDFQEGGEIRTKALNYEFNYQMACTQQVADALNRTIMSPPYENTNYSKILPKPIPKRALVWNDQGNGLNNSSLEIATIEQNLQSAISTVDTKVSEVAEINSNLQTMYNNVETSLTQVNDKIASTENLITQVNNKIATTESLITQTGNLVDQASGYITEMENGLKLPMFSILTLTSAGGMLGTEVCDGHIVSKDKYPDFWKKALEYKTLGLGGNTGYSNFTFTETTYQEALTANGKVTGVVIDEVAGTIKMPTIPDSNFHYYIVCANIAQPLSVEDVTQIHTELEELRNNSGGGGGSGNITEEIARTIVGNRVYQSPRVQLPELEVPVNFAHNLNFDTAEKIMNAEVRVYAINKVADNGFLPGEAAELMTISSYLGRFYTTYWDLSANNVIICGSSIAWGIIQRGGLSDDCLELTDLTKWDVSVCITY